MTALKVGDRIKDNDLRMFRGNRVLEVCEITVTHVIARHGSAPWTRIRRDRIYTDGKPRRSGFSLVRDET